MNADEALTAFDEAEQRGPQVRVVEQHPESVVEADRVELLDVGRPKHLDVVAEDCLIGACRSSRWLERGSFRTESCQRSFLALGLAIPHRQIGHEQTARLLGLGLCLARNRGVDACFLILLDLLPLKGGAAQHDDRADSDH